MRFAHCRLTTTSPSTSTFQSSSYIFSYLHPLHDTRNMNRQCATQRCGRNTLSDISTVPLPPRDRTKCRKYILKAQIYEMTSIPSTLKSSFSACAVKTWRSQRPHRFRQNLLLRSSLSSSSPSSTGTRQKPRLRDMAEDGPGVAWPCALRSAQEEAQAVSDVRSIFIERSGSRGSEDLIDGIDDATILWYVRDRRYDSRSAAEKLTKMMLWRKKLGAGGMRNGGDESKVTDPFPYDLVEEELATGKVMIHKSCDSYGRPVVIVDCSKHILGEWSGESSQRVTGYVLDQCIASNRLERKNSLPSKDNPASEDHDDDDDIVLLGIFDLRRFTSRNADMAYARFLVSAFFDYYPRRLGRVLLVDAPIIFRPLYAVIKPLLGKYGKLVRFVKKEQLKEYFKKPEDIPDIFKN